MPPTLARLRCHLGRFFTAGGTGHWPGGEGGGTQTITVVPLTVRAQTADGADIRLLLEARLASHRLPAEDVERITLALVVPAAIQWVRRRELAALDAGLERTLPDVEEAVREPLAALGADLFAIVLVAGEHLLVSPSADEFHGPG